MEKQPYSIVKQRNLYDMSKDKQTDIPKWDDTEEVIPSFEDTEELNEEPKMSKGASVHKGAAQGLSLGFNDEIGGAVMGFRDWLGSSLSGESKMNLKTLKSKYKQYRDFIREDTAKARADNPKSFVAGEVGSALATGVAGIGKAAIKKGTTKLLSKAGAKQAAIGTGKLAGEGAAYSVGTSEDKSVGDAVKGARDSLVTAGALRGVGKLAKGTKNLALGKSSGKTGKAANNERVQEIFNIQEGSKAGTALAENRLKRGVDNPLGAAEDAADFALTGSSKIVDPKTGESLKILTPGASLPQMVQKTKRITELGTQAIDNVVQKAGKVPGNSLEYFETAKFVAQDSFTGGTGKFLPSARKAKKSLDNLQEQFQAEYAGKEDLVSVLHMKRDVDRLIRETNSQVLDGHLIKGKDTETLLQAYSTVREVLSDNIKSQLKEVDPSALKVFNNANNAVHQALNLQKGLQSKVPQSLWEELISQPGQKGLTAGFTVSMLSEKGKEVGKLATVAYAGKALYNRYGKASAAIALDHVYKGMQRGNLDKVIKPQYAKELSSAFRKGGDALIRRHLFLLENSPEYNRQMSGIIPEDK